MHRLLVLSFLAGAFFVSCSKDEKDQQVQGPIPDVLTGVVRDVDLTPVNITTPGLGKFFIDVNNVRYVVEFNAVDYAASNAVLIFDTDTILTNDSREFANLGNDAISYNPVLANRIILSFHDGSGRRVTGFFDVTTSFGGTFGQAVISEWREPNDPTKPTQKAKDDFINLVHRYADKDGPGPDIAPQWLLVTISRV